MQKALRCTDMGGSDSARTGVVHDELVSETSAAFFVLFSRTGAGLVLYVCNVLLMTCKHCRGERFHFHQRLQLVEMRPSLVSTTHHYFYVLVDTSYGL